MDADVVICLVQPCQECKPVEPFGALTFLLVGSWAAGAGPSRSGRHMTQVPGQAIIYGSNTTLFYQSGWHFVGVDTEAEGNYTFGCF